ncbi:hypothetical protein ACFLR2_00520 [Chlamydiota bacterium]
MIDHKTHKETQLSLREILSNLRELIQLSVLQIHVSLTLNKIQIATNLSTMTLSEMHKSGLIRNAKMNRSALISNAKSPVLMTTNIALITIDPTTDATKSRTVD